VHPGPACVTVRICPVLLPAPLPPAVIVTHAALLVVVQVQSALAVIVTVPVPPAAGMD
jgi:hypothetical protein